jgi:hypothetical protein
MNSFAVKCRCQHCNQSIEFEAENAGAMVACPGCGMETQLFVPPVQQTAVRPPPPKAVARPKIKRSAWETWGAVFSVALFIVGCGLVFVGCSDSFEESLRKDPSAIRETVNSIQYCTGFILIGLSPIIAAAGRIISWTLENDRRQNS